MMLSMQLLIRTLRAWKQDKGSVLAAALSFYTVLSLPPLLLLSVSVGGLFFRDQRVREELIAQMQHLIGDQGASIVRIILTSAQESPHTILATVLSILLLIFGASGVMVELQHALNSIWKVEPKHGKFIHRFFLKRMLSFALVLAVGFLLVVSLILSAIASFLALVLLEYIPSLDFAMPLMDIIVSFILIVILFSMLFKFLPDAIIAWKDVWVGALLTAGLFIIGKSLIGIYLSSSLIFSTYGFTGSVLILFLWIFYSSQVLLLGAEFTRMYANKFGSGIQPDADAYSLEPTQNFFRRILHSFRKK